MESYQGLQLLFRHYCTGLLVSDVCAAICLESQIEGNFIKLNFSLLLGRHILVLKKFLK